MRGEPYIDKQKNKKKSGKKNEFEGFATLDAEYLEGEEPEMVNIDNEEDDFMDSD